MPFDIPIGFQSLMADWCDNMTGVFVDGQWQTTKIWHTYGSKKTSSIFRCDIQKSVIVDRRDHHDLIAKLSCHDFIHQFMNPGSSIPGVLENHSTSSICMYIYIYTYVRWRFPSHASGHHWVSKDINKPTWGQQNNRSVAGWPLEKNRECFTKSTHKTTLPGAWPEGMKGMW